MYLKFRTKDGEEGPRGYHGFPGDKGDSGKCDQFNCRFDTVRIMIQKLFEKKLNRKLNTEEKKILMENRIVFNSTINNSIIANSPTLSQINISDLKDLEIFFKEEGVIASNRELYLPTFENN